MCGGAVCVVCKGTRLSLWGPSVPGVGAFCSVGRLQESFAVLLWDGMAVLLKMDPLPWH